jgi:hypothetical protein
MTRLEMENAMPIAMLDPVQEPVATMQRPAPRLSTLEGKTLGLYNNGKLNSVRLLELIAAEFARDFAFGIRTGTYHSYKLMTPEEWEGVDQCDAVILANGDCGACSSSGIANAISLEKQGIPTLLITTNPFVDAVKTMAGLCGMPDVHWAVIKHPIGSLQEDELRERARVCAAQFREIIFASPAVPSPATLAAAGAR